VRTHVKVIGVLNVVFGVLLICGAFFTNLILSVLSAFVGAQDDPDAAVGAAVLGFTGTILSVVLFGLGAVYAATGWGLYRLRPWARIAGIILAAVALPKIPFGTIFGSYALVILFKAETEGLFARPAG
jgi:hypothetical protein